MHTTKGNAKVGSGFLVEKPIISYRGCKVGGAIMPEIMRWLWRDGPVSTDPNDKVERGFRQPVAKKK